MQLFFRAISKIFRTIGMGEVGWNISHAGGTWHTDRKSEILLEKVLRLANGERIVEFGCGDGSLPSLLPENSFSSYLGTDISSYAIKKCEKRYEDLDRPIKFQVSNMTTWGGEDKCIQLIVCEECINYLNNEEILRFFKICSKSLTPTGHLLIVIHSETKHADLIKFINSISEAAEVHRKGDRIYLVLSSCGLRSRDNVFM